MVGTSSFRDRYRSNALKQLAKERASKKDTKVDDENENDSDSDDSLERGRSAKKFKNQGNSLISILPEPTNSTSSPGFDLLAELIAEHKNDDKTDDSEDGQDAQKSEGPSDMIEVDVSKLVNETTPQFHIPKTSTAEAIKMPKSKEKEKNQITHLAKLAKAAEFVIQERASQGRANKTAARSKYGW